MFKRTQLISAVAAVAAAVSVLPVSAPAAPAKKLEVLEKPAQRLTRSIDVHERKAERQRRREEADSPEFASPESFGVSQATLDAIASCESGGDPAAVSSDGTYRGKYQFDAGTWASMGGSGDPAAAPEAEQDMRAAQLYAASGSSPWPICGA